MRYLRLVWRRLTSMRTALILLFLLAVAAVPGSLLPQRPLGAAKVDNYIASHGAVGDVLNTFGFFDVFGSAWFAAIYLLLFVSLIGCLIPRIRLHAKAIRRRPLPAPRNLGRLPESARFETGDDVRRYAAAARTTLGRRWRIVEREEPGGVVTLSAEKGYSRETGNLIFHVALLVSLVLIAVGRLYHYQGSLIVQQGQGFCNSIAKYDQWQPGRLAAEGDVSPAKFCVTDLSKFTADYGSNGEATKFAAALTYQPTLTSPEEHAMLSVNHPLRIGGDRVYLLGHGFAPSLTIRLPGGRIVRDTENFVPDNASTLLSEGVFKEPGADDANQDIGVRGLFAPTPVFDGTAVSSSSPQATNPVLAVSVFEGDLNTDGLPQSIYTLDSTKMKQIGLANLRVGQTKKLAHGVSITFDGWTPWVSIQVSHDPAQDYLLISAAAMVLGLFGSLGVRRRRVWLRITPSNDADGRSLTVDDAVGTSVAVGGLARSDTGNFAGEFQNLLERLRTAGTTAAERVPATSAGRE